MKQNFQHPSDGFIDDADVMQPPTCEATAIPRPPYNSPDFSDGMLMIAIDRRTITVPEVELLDHAVKVHMGALIGRLAPMTTDDFKMGQVIANELNLGVPLDWFAKILGLKGVDRNLKMALEASLSGTLATRIAPFDLEAILLALGNFIHAHPYFSKITKEGEWKPPYGEHTAYQMAWFNAPGAALDHAAACAEERVPAANEEGAR
jgi:hypothetical protein